MHLSVRKCVRVSECLCTCILVYVYIYTHTYECARVAAFLFAVASVETLVGFSHVDLLRYSMMCVQSDQGWSATLKLPILGVAHTVWRSEMPCL